MTTYVPEIVPDLSDPKILQAFLEKEFRSISRSLFNSDMVSLDPLFVAPPKPFEGMIQYADGTSWNPGEGEGYYGYVNGAWSKLNSNAGMVVDSVVGTYATNANLTTAIPFDDTIPQSGEGTQIISVSITPKSTTNKLRARFCGQATLDTTAEVASIALFLNSDTGAAKAQYTTTAGVNQSMTMALEHEWIPGSISSQTIKIRAGPRTGIIMRFNGNSVGRIFGGVQSAILVVEEIKA